MDEDSEDTNLLSASREPKPKEVGCKLRVKRVGVEQRRKERGGIGGIKQPSPPH